MDGAIVAAIIAEALWRFSLCFSILWTVLYITGGSWAKVGYRNLGASPESALEKRYGPVVLSHTLFSVVFVNPVCIFHLLWTASDLAVAAARLENLPGMFAGLGVKYSAIQPVIEGTFSLVVVLAYFLLFSLITDVVVMRMSARVRCLKRLAYKGDLLRWTLVHSVTLLLLFLLTGAVSWGLVLLFWGS